MLSAAFGQNNLQGKQCIQFASHRGSMFGKVLVFRPQSSSWCSMAYIGETTHRHHLAIVKSRTRTWASREGDVGVNPITDKLYVAILANLVMVSTVVSVKACPVGLDGLLISMTRGVPHWATALSKANSSEDSNHG